MADGNRNGGGVKTTFDASFIDRVAAGLDVMRGYVPGFFTPTPPLPPVAQDTARGRQYDYQMGFNTNTRPRSEEQGVDFQTLRTLADGYDLLRLVIETRKDQLCKMRWNITARDKNNNKVAKDDKRVLELEKFLRKPDRIHTWNEWLRILIEDMLVIDAATVYPRMTRGSTIYSLDVVDGGTIKPLINNDGRTPIAPEHAYQQIIKGMPAVGYSTEELIYKPRNLRSWKVYGYSPVEQIMMTVNIALRRQLWQLSYFTEGNIPEAFGNVPEEWTPQQIREFQSIWDSMIEGDGSSKRKLKFLPGGVGVTLTKEAVNKDLFDEWLARIVCFAFSISPQALVQIMNRATAETAAETAEQEGLAPLMTWVQDMMNDIIERYFGYDDLVFSWDDGKELDPKTQSEIHKNYLDCGVLDTEEVRMDIGRDPRQQPNKNAVVAPGDEISDSSSQPLGAGAEGDANASSGAATAPVIGEDGKPIVAPVAAAGAGGGSTVQDTAMNGTQISSLIEIISLVADKGLPPDTARFMINAAFPAIKPELVDGMLDGLKNFEPKPEPVPVVAGAPVGKEGATPAKPEAKPGDADEEEEPVAKHVHNHDEDELYKARDEVKQLTTVLANILGEVGDDVAAQIAAIRTEPEPLAKAKRPSPASLLNKVNLKGVRNAQPSVQASLTSAAQRSAAKAVKQAAKKGGDSLVQLANTRAEAWAREHSASLVTDLTDSTREMLRSTITTAEEEGWSNSRLASELRENHAFSKSRAKTIARTESKTANSEGALAGWKASGVKMKKEWSLSADESTCDICEGNAAEGAIPLEDSFSSGDDTAPAHPNCNCSVLPVFDEDEEE